MNEIKEHLVDAIGSIISLAVIFFFFILILYSYNSIDDPLKEAFTLTLYFLSFSSTLAAAYVATLLFNDWKEQHNAKIYSDFAIEILKIYEDVFYKMLTIDRHLLDTRSNIKNINSRPVIVIEDQIEKPRKIIEEYKKLSKNFSNDLSILLHRINQLLQKATIYAMLVKDHSLLEKTIFLFDELEKVSSDLQSNYDNSLQSQAKEFELKIQYYGEEIHLIAEKNISEIIMNLKEKIEA